MKRRAAVYLRRSDRRSDDADLSDRQQESACRRALPPDAIVTVLSDSGGHNSGYTDQRDAYRRMIGMVERDEVDIIAVATLDRLARRTSLMLQLRDSLAAHNVTLVIASLPGANFDSAAGRFMFSTLCAGAQLQRDMDSEKQAAMAMRLFEDGRAHGRAPFGYRTLRVDGQIVRPRQLVIDDAEAAIVRRIFELSAHESTESIARRLNAETVAARDSFWTRNGVASIIRRAQVYLGHVQRRRGLDVRPGQHPPIIDDATARAARIGARTRFNPGRRPKPYRTYLLSGMIVCANCGRRLEGQTRVSRGHEWSYYVCRSGHRRVVASEVEGAVLAMVTTMRLPQRAIDLARAELQRRLSMPEADVGTRQRVRLTRRLDRLAKLYSWGDMDESTYRREVQSTRDQLAGIPAGGKVVLFDQHRRVIEDMQGNIERATPAQLKELARLLIERVEARDGEVASVAWTGPGRPFFEPVGMAPPDGLEPPTQALGRPRSVH